MSPSTEEVLGRPYRGPEDSDILRKAYRSAHPDYREEIPPDTTIPEPEVRSTPIEPADPRMPGGAKSIIKLAVKEGWGFDAAYSRGPWMHSTRWVPIGISDLVLVRLGLPSLDKPTELAVASWRDKSFEWAYYWPARSAQPVRVNSAELKARIRHDEESA